MGGLRVRKNRVLEQSTPKPRMVYSRTLAQYIQHLQQMQCLATEPALPLSLPTLVQVASDMHAAF